MRISSFQPLIPPQELTRSEGLNRAVTGATPAAGVTAPSPTAAQRAEQPAEFAQVLGKELTRVNDVLAEADRQSQLVATGQAEDLQQAVTAMAEADLALQVTMRVTQKAIAAYQEISRMQI